MPRNLWENLDRLYEQYHPEHKEKIGAMEVRDQKVVSVVFKGEEEEQPAMLFKVVNKTPAGSSVGTLHNVMISRDRQSRQLTMWCGDKSVVKADGQREDKCHFWGEKAKRSGEFLCKHCVYVYGNIGSTQRAHIEKSLGASISPLLTGNRLPQALKLWKNAFLYGPTGSGKTHRVREALKDTGYAVVRLNISDGLEDVDALQKILPAEKGGWTRRVGELRRGFDSAKTTKTVVVLEEIMRSSRSLRNLLLKAMDREDGSYCLHDITTGEYVMVDAGNLLFCATANLGYADTSELDPALARRFPLFIFQDYDTSEELKVVSAKVGESLAKKLCAIAVEVRTQCRAGRLPVPLDTGSLIEWADVITQGVSPVDAAGLTWLCRVVNKDNMGYPEQGEVEILTELLADKL